MSNRDSSTINIDAARDALTAWGTAITNFNSGKVKAANESFFTTLADVGLDSGFMSSYDQNNVALENALNSSKTSILNALDNMHNLDDSVMNDLHNLLGLQPPETNNNNNNNNGNNNNGGNSSSTTSTLLENSKEQLEMYKNMSMSDLSAVAQELMKLAEDNNTTLDKLLSDSQYATKIHSALLLSQHIPDDFKLEIEKGQTNISQKLLQSIFTGKEPSLIGINENTTQVIKQYLTMVAGNNNISLEQLLTDEAHSKTLSESLSSFNSVHNYIGNLKEDEVTPSLLSIYDGVQQENVNSGGMSIMRSYIEQLAESNNTNAETMLTSDSNVDMNLSGLGKTSVFMDTMSSFDSKEAASIISSLLNIKSGE